MMEKFRTLKKGKRAKKHGYLVRSKTNNGKKVLKRRKKAGRKQVTI